ncbi:ABC transporter substrate-binding protein [Paenibacillus tarimensis]|uniref:ABC transporter substrate-binding protein n=1 Tax=Paenibacillus tarimensis TaxID=416012 RepID=UPI001F4847BA|nr:sugar ABC transporter substrate-binding protein [Paenibacillus tarimensis]MCF2943343.1 sugar ABC transporter substrate-binding protein [Paenibacillus tarimensis]
MRKWLTIMLAFTLVFSLAACSGGSNSGGNNVSSNGGSGNSGDGGEQKPVKLRMAWWGGQPRHDYTLEVIKLYQQENPHVTIEPEYANFDDYWKRLAPQAAANELPDIIQMDISYFTQYAQKGQLADLTPYIGNQINVDNISENAIAGGKLDDKIYAFNVGVNTVQFQYNPETLKKAGIEEIDDENWTWEDYVRIAKQVKDNTGLYFDTGMRPEVFFGYFLRTKGQHLYNAEGTALGYEDDALFVEFFGRLAELVKYGAAPAPDVKAQIKGPEDDPMVKGTGVGIWQWTNQYVSIQQIAGVPLEMLHMPGPDREQGLYLKPSMYFAISKNSKQKEEAAKFIDFWVNNVEANKLIKGERGVPVSSVVKDAIKPELDEAQAKVFDYVAWAEENSTPMDPPDPVGAAEIMNMLKSYSEQMDFQKITPEEAAKRFREEANAVLGKNK